MDSLIRSVQELKELSGYKGTAKQFKSSKELVTFCRKNQFIADIKHPEDICKNAKEDYFVHLSALAKKYLCENKELKHWEKFKSHPDNRKVHKILFEFGVYADLFSDTPEEKYDPVAPNSKKLTLEEMYEVYQFKYNFDGTFASFKRQITTIYGSYAEYCLEKGYDINNTKWESDEIALRVASKIGNPNDVQKKCPSLLKYLEEHKLMKQAFKKEAA